MILRKERKIACHLKQRCKAEINPPLHEKTAFSKSAKGGISAATHRWCGRWDLNPHDIAATGT